MTGKPRRQAKPAPTGPTIHWHLRQIMATRGMFSTTDLILGFDRTRHLVVPRADLSTGHPHPERLNTRVLAALCDLLDCTVGELIETRHRHHDRHDGQEAGTQARRGR